MKLQKLLFLFSAFLALFSSSAVFAGTAISVSPLIVDQKAEIRDIFNESLTVSNNTDHRMNLYTFVNNVSVGEGGGIEEFLDPSKADNSSSLANWIQISRGVIELNPGEKKTIDFSYQVALSAKPGKYHASISFAEGSTRTEAEAKLGQNPSLILSVEVTEEVNEFLQLKKFAADKVFFAAPPVGFVYRIENIGNKPLVPKGQIVLYDRKGREIAEVPLNREGKSIAPGEEAEFKAEWEGKGALGKYKALLQADYGGVQKKSLNDTVFFFVIPWQKIALFFAIAVLFLVILIYIIHRRYEREHLASLHPASAEHVLSIGKERGISHNDPVRIIHPRHVIDLRRKHKK